MFHNDHTYTIQVYSVTVMTHVMALEAGQSNQGTFEPITPARVFFVIRLIILICSYMHLSNTPPFPKSLHILINHIIKYTY